MNTIYIQLIKVSLLILLLVRWETEGINELMI
nr:MAG TPA: hypothetical protein [Caudoviricetes sp.]